MIKVEDLRIGDLVRIVRDCKYSKMTLCAVTGIPAMKEPDKIKVVSLSAINDNDDSPWGTWCCNVEGILLTPEILEKNGWKRISHKGLPWALFRKKGCSVRIAYDSDDDKVPFSVGKGIQELKNINYVHELQHILWALGEDANLKI